MIGDGMGLTQISSGMYANNNSTALEGFEYVGLSKTHALDKLVTDSAASGTAMACGVKTYNGVIGIDGKNKSHPSILEICQKKGYRTGLVATSSIVHATPASFYAKVISRRLYEKIAFQLSQHNVDLFVVGLPTNLKGLETDATKITFNFIKTLKKKYKQIDVKAYDERFTSKMAKDSLIFLGKNKKYRRKKSNIDKVSASIILQSYLQRNS